MVKHPKFLETIPNVNVTAGRDVDLPCVVENIGNYKVEGGGGRWRGWGVVENIGNYKVEGDGRRWRGFPNY